MKEVKKQVDKKQLFCKKKTSVALSRLTTHSFKPFWFFSNWKILVGSPTLRNSLKFEICIRRLYCTK